MFLTVFTPAYNRAHTLGRTYQSLRQQSCKDFCWLIIDDGSIDNTKNLVESWLFADDNGFEIKYFYKENGGLHTAYNCAIENMNSELAVCIDSDDYMPANAVQLIKEKWLKDGSIEYAGIIGLDYTMEGKLIGGLLPDQKAINLIDISTGKYQIKKGDKKDVVRVDLYKSVAPMKVYEGEKNFNPHYMHLEISRKYDFLVLNKELCTVDYQDDGMTANIFRQYYNSPNSFLEIRKQYFSFPERTRKGDIRNMIHLVSSSLLARRYSIELYESKHKVLMLLCTVPGLLLMLLTIKRGNI